MSKVPSKTKEFGAYAATALGATAMAAGTGGVGIPDGEAVLTWPTILGGLIAMVYGLGGSMSNFKAAALAPPVDDAGKSSARYTCSIAIGQAHREGDQAMVDLLSKTVPPKKPAPPPEAHA